MKTTTKGPYKYFDDRPDRFVEFTRLCYQECVLGGPGTDCPILNFLTNSILDVDVRWEENWVELDKNGTPVCQKRKAK